MPKIVLYAKALRVHHWVKNILILAPAVFSAQLRTLVLFDNIVLGFIAFSFVASAVYVVNDLQDIQSDRNHPKKKNRVIASGSISVREARRLGLTVGVMGFALALYLSPSVFGMLCLYLVANVLYSKWLKKLAIWELLMVTGFYIVRIMVGGVLADVHLSSWLILTTFFLALFLVAVKRRQELLRGGATRNVLQMYNKEFLDITVVISLTSSILFYTLYTTTKSEVFVWSVLFVVYGLIRYVYLVVVDNRGEEPELIMMTDRGILLAFLGWVLFVIGYFYFY